MITFILGETLCPEFKGIKTKIINAMLSRDNEKLSALNSKGLRLLCEIQHHDAARETLCPELKGIAYRKVGFSAQRGFVHTLHCMKGSPVRCGCGACISLDMLTLEDLGLQALRSSELRGSHSAFQEVVICNLFRRLDLNTKGLCR